MKIPIIAISSDSFKGCMGSMDAAKAMERGLKRVFPSVDTRKIPMADGGEGTVSAMLDALGGHLESVTVSGPLGEPVTARYGLLDSGRTAVIEMAAASGLTLLKPKDRNPMHTTTRGTGELILAAMESGATKILLGLGGSATNDGGMGMARVLGVRFLNHQGRDIGEGGHALIALDTIDISGLHPGIKSLNIEIACDVNNPFCGPRGAAVVFGPQKGATPDMVEHLDNGMHTLAQCIQRTLGVRVAGMAGAGAAGGLGGGLVAFLNGKPRPGAEMVAQAVGLKEQLRGVDLVITGEGRLDGQTLSGKVPAYIGKVAKSLSLPVVAICGIFGPGWKSIHETGIDACFEASAYPIPEEELPSKGPDMVADCAEQVGRLLKISI